MRYCRLLCSQQQRPSIPDQAHLLHFYLTVIRPVLEYAAPVWHHLLTKSQTDQIEAIQKRALNIIYTGTHGMPYANSLFLAELANLAEHREKLSRKFFNSVEEPRSCLHHLLPPPRDPALLSCLRLPLNSPVFLTEPKNISPSYPTLSASIRPAKFQ